MADMVKAMRIDVQVLGDRGYPVASGRMTEEMSKDFTAVVAKAQAANPSATAEEVIRAIWRLGTRKVQHVLSSGLPLHTEVVPQGSRPIVYTVPQPIPVPGVKP